MYRVKRKRAIPVCGTDDLALAAAAMHAFSAAKLARGVLMPKQPVFENRFFKRFISIGKLCAGAGVDMRAYTDYAFNSLQKNSYEITPKQLDDPRMLAAFKREVRTGREGAPGDWIRLMRTLLAASERQRVPEDMILISPMQPYPAWFRVLAHDDPDPRILEIYGAAAVSEMEADESILRFVTTTFPKRLRALRENVGRHP